MSNDLVSIIIPTYNRAYCLPKTIESALNQSHQNFEIIIIDDGSSDDTEEVVKRNWSNDPRIRYIRQKNAGVSVARNRGIDQARGEYIALLDSDDTWSPWKLEVQLACFKRFPTAVMVHSEMEAIDPDGKIYDKQFLRTTYDGYRQFPISELYPESCRLADFLSPIPADLHDTLVWFGDIFSHMLTGNLIHTSTVIIKRSKDGFIEHYDEGVRTEETFDFHLRVTQRGPVVFLDAPSLRYQRGHNDHLWTPEMKYPPQMLHDLNCRNLRIVEPHIIGGGDRIRISKKVLTDLRARTHGWTALTAIGVGKYGEMINHLIKSLSLRPFQPKLVARIAYYTLRKIVK